jgi:putative tryptophan/tyrosine transport system substrate-binding protein
MGREGLMRRRDVITLLGGAAVTWPVAARAQQPAMLMIGYLDSRSPEAVANRLRGFRQGLKESGYIENENVVIAYRWAENQPHRLQELAADLVRRGVAVIITAGPPPTFAAKAATTTIPILFLVGVDPVRLDLVASLARPGSNMTGINIFNVELAAKRLELLRELVPRAARIALLVNPADVAITETQVKEVQAAARAIGLQIQVFNADSSPEIDAAFETMGRERPDAIFVGVSPFLNGRRVQLAQLAAFHRLPAIYAVRDYAEVGGLMSYGSDVVGGFRQVGVYAGRILKGAKPADLPVVQSSKFELVINASTARMLGLTVPDKLLAAADEVIE